jgi:hypothetical protein
METAERLGGLSRADLLARSHEKLDIQLKNLRLHLQAGRQAPPNTARLVALAARDRLKY